MRYPVCLENAGRKITRRMLAERMPVTSVEGVAATYVIATGDMVSRKYFWTADSVWSTEFADAKIYDKKPLPQLIRILRNSAPFSWQGNAYICEARHMAESVKQARFGYSRHHGANKYCRELVRAERSAA